MERPRNKGRFIKTTPSNRSTATVAIDHNYAHYMKDKPALEIEISTNTEWSPPSTPPKKE